MNEALFSLDIGTRSVVGVVSIHNGQAYEVIDYEIQHHPDRAMYDGQIHDIQKVTEVVRSVKDILEERTGYSFKNVAIAAAGRALKTIKVKVERMLDIGQTITQEIINNVEMEGIQKAQSQIEVDKRSGESQYYCVGYNVSNYYIDGNLNINPRDHRGNTLGVELIATFLPHIVVDSLYTVVDRAGLEVLNLTLEPIAAINVAIPPNLRLLNLALVDVGAGTSDIAITKEGTVISFGMVASAGDKFTEAIAQKYLLNFNQAEALKLNLNKSDSQSFTDILMMSHTKSTAEIVDEIKFQMIETAEMIAKQILEHNERVPSAVFCIGGGCQVPGFTEILAAELDLPKERVVIKPVETLENVKFIKAPLRGPEFITPLGIGVTALKEKENDFLQIMVNEKSIRLFNSKQLSVSDALILVGYQARALLPERGTSLAYTLNGKLREVKGGYGEAAKIYVNGALTSLDHKLKNKDSIYVEPGIRGTDAKIKLSELLKPTSFVFNDERLYNKYRIKVNDLEVSLDYELSNGDVIEYEEILKVKDLLNYRGLNVSEFDVYVNGEVANPERYIEHSDIVRTRLKKHEVTMEELYDDHLIEAVEDFELESTEVVIEHQEAKKEEPISTYNYHFMVNGKLVTVENVSRKMVFVDIFEHIDFDISKPQGILELTLNSNKANYTDYLKDGDIITIAWQQKKG
ncbi:MAG: pilus assembly protein PilM [Clostridia bacterium]|nr:pilus assembly protein PilM [Clostridia bacterium]